MAVQRSLSAERPFLRASDIDTQVADLALADADRLAGAGVRRTSDDPHRPVAGTGEEPELTGGGRDDLGSELAAAVEQPHVSTGERLAAGVNESLDHRLPRGDAGVVDRGLIRCTAHEGQTSFSIGTPTSEPYSVQEPS